MESRSQAERRRETRLLCADLVVVRWTDADGRPREETANLEDISEHGLCLQLETGIAPGSTVEIAAGRAVLRGGVRYCRHDELGELVGVEFAEGDTWPKRSYKPKHLLDPRILLADKALRNLKP
jgi:hypothetical protein